MFVIVALGVALFVVAGGDLLGGDLAGGTAAVAAVLTVFATLGLLVLNMSTEERARRAEQDNTELRAIAERQAQAMTEQASVSRDQLALLQAEHLESGRIQLHVLYEGFVWIQPNNSHGRYWPCFQLINMSRFGLLIHKVTMETVSGTREFPVRIRKSPSQIEEESAAILLAPGEGRYGYLYRANELSALTAPASAQKVVIVSIECLYPGLELMTLRYHMEYSNWEENSAVIITPVSVTPSAANTL
jgi:hypothetical protein